MLLYYLKALHIIFVVTWFAGLFYIVRLFIYHTEASSKSEPEKSILQSQFKIMEKRLWYGITAPSMIGTIFFGLWLMAEVGYGWEDTWLVVKLCFVAGLLLYHLSCGYIYRQLQKDIVKYTSNQLRIWNEIATFFLVSIVFLVVFKNTTNFLYGLCGLIIFAFLLMASIKLYKKLRKG